MSVVSHIGLAVTDIERSTRFYCDVLDFVFDRDLHLDPEPSSSFLKLDAPGKLMARYLLRDDFQLELLLYDPGAKPRAHERVMNETGLTHISMVVDDVPGTARKAIEYGGELMSTIGEIAAMVRDPDGQIVELLTMDYLEGVRSERLARQRAAERG